MFLHEKENYLCLKVRESQSLEDYLLNKNISLKTIRRLYKKNKILVNNQFRRKDLNVYRNEEIKIYYEDEYDEIEATKMKLDIVYEDSGIIIINKPKGIPVHPSRLHQENTLANGIKNYYKEKNINRKIRLINRLDKDTNGLIIIGKNPIISSFMSSLIRENKIDRKYLAWVEGRLKNNEGIIDLPILKLEGNIKRVINELGERSITEYKVIKRMDNKTLLKLKLHTGRGHQIRVHLSSLGYPIIGDSIYGSGKNLDYNLQLKAYSLEFIHPIWKDKIKINL